MLWRESEVNVFQSCSTRCDPMDYTELSMARILEWVAFPFSRGSSQPRDRNQVSHIAGGLFTSWATREAQEGSEYKIAHSPRAQFCISCHTTSFHHPL